MTTRADLERAMAAAGLDAPAHWDEVTGSTNVTALELAEAGAAGVDAGRRRPPDIRAWAHGKNLAGPARSRPAVQRGASSPARSRRRRAPPAAGRRHDGGRGHPGVGCRGAMQVAERPADGRGEARRHPVRIGRTGRRAAARGDRDRCEPGSPSRCARCSKPGPVDRADGSADPVPAGVPGRLPPRRAGVRAGRGGAMVPGLGHPRTRCRGGPDRRRHDPRPGAWLSTRTVD